MTIELVSAFGPTVLSNYADATKGNDRKGGKSIGLVIDYLSDRIEPAANTDTLSESALYADYTAWCRASGRVALAIPEFVGRLRSAACGQRASEKSASARIATAASASSPPKKNGGDSG